MITIMGGYSLNFSMDEAKYDPVLRALVHLAEYGVSLTATFTIRGTVISGRLVGQEAYLQQIRSQFIRQVHEENMPGLPEVLHLFKEASAYADSLYLHLDKAQIVDAPPPANQVEGIWRVRLDSIDGFSFGR